MPRKPISQTWTSDRALLLCHGVGNYRDGDYDSVKAALRSAVGAQWDSIAVYEVYYDEINQWISEKNGIAPALAQALAFLRGKVDTTAVAQAAADGAGDVVWPVLSLAARDALRRAYISQLIQLVIDGEDAGLDPRDQKVVLMGHSLGCFHTYEALWALATDPQFRMLPALGDAPVWRHVVLLASPVQLIRSVAEKIRALIPKFGGLATTRASGLGIPAQVLGGNRFPATLGMTSLTGNFDPVGGHLLGQKLDWAYMNIPNEPKFRAIVETQDIVSRPADADLATLFLQLVNRNDPGISIENPHSWERYVNKNAAKIAECLLA